LGGRKVGKVKRKRGVRSKEGGEKQVRKFVRGLNC